MLPDGIVKAWTRNVRIAKKRSTAIANDLIHSRASDPALARDGFVGFRPPRLAVELLTWVCLRRWYHLIAELFRCTCEVGEYRPCAHGSQSEARGGKVG